MPKPLEYLVTAIEWKAEDGADPSILTGYASTFGNVDLGGDVVMKGAFLKSISRIKAEGIPLLADHMASTTSVLGTIFDAAENQKGLVIKARLSKAPSAQDTAIKLAEGHLSKLSIGYETMDESYEERDGMKVRLLKELKLWETSVVVFPMNPQADITTVKQVVSMAECLPVDSPRQIALKQMLTEDAVEHERLLGQKYLPKFWTTGPALEERRVDDVPAGEPDESRTGTKDAVADEAAAEAVPGTAAGDESAKSGDEPAHWDQFRSQAVLAGRDAGDVDPAKRAGLAERLRIQLAEIDSAHQ